MAQLITVTTGNYTNKDAISNTIRYITRTRINEDRKHELISYGSPNVTCYGGEEAIDRAIKEFKDIQRYYCKTEGRKVHHETLNLTDEEAKSFFTRAQIDAFALDCSRVYFQQGYQVFYAAHYSKKYRLHVHFIINSVNYRTGNKYHCLYKENAERNDLFNMILNAHQNYNKQWLEQINCYYIGLKYPVFRPEYSVGGM